MVSRDHLKLGRKPQIEGRKKLQFADFLKTVPEHPIVVDDTPTDLSFGMDLNDQYGDCVVAAWDHFQMVVEKLLTGSASPFTASELIDFYKTQNPGFPNQDDGMVIQTFLEYLVKNDYILGFAAVDVMNEEELKAAIYLGLSVVIGVDLDVAQQSQVIWDYKKSAEWGGHCVNWVGYSGNPDNFTCITWGEELDMTINFIRHQCSEVWFILTQDHVNHLDFRKGFDLSKFAAAYTEITGATFPVISPKPPIVPPQVDPADAALVEVLDSEGNHEHSWEELHHVGGNGIVAKAIKDWRKSKNL